MGDHLETIFFNETYSNTSEAINEQPRSSIEAACTYDDDAFAEGFAVAFAAAVLLALQIQEKFGHRYVMPMLIFWNY